MKTTIEIKKHRNFSDPNDHQSFATIRLSSVMVGKVGGRNKYVRLKYGNHSICRQVQGIGNHELICRDTGSKITSKAQFTADAIEIDYQSCLDLELPKSKEQLSNNFYACDLVIESATLRDIFKLHWKHPNLAYRTPFQLSIVSLFLGAVGLFLGVMSLFN